MFLMGGSSHRKVDLKPHEVLTQVFMPTTRLHEYVKEFKQSHRRDDDIAIVNAGMRVAFKQDASGADLPDVCTTSRVLVSHCLPYQFAICGRLHASMYT